MAHRKRTGDPTSLPDMIHDEPSRAVQPPLITAEERIARGLPAKGRLRKKQMNEIRAELGLDELPKQTKKRDKSIIKEPTLLTKEQRVALGWTDQGRLPQDLIERLRAERQHGILLENSKAIELYMDMMVEAKAAKDTKDGKPTKSMPAPTETGLRHSRTGDYVAGEDVNNSLNGIAHASASSPTITTTKRKADGRGDSSSIPKKPRIKSNAAQKNATESASLQRSATPESITSTPADQETAIHSPSVPLSEQIPACADSFIGVDITQEPEGHLADSVTDRVSPDIEEPHSPTPLADTPADPSNSLSAADLLAPDMSKLDAASQARYRTYEERSSSGFYFDPFSRHKTMRGRPRKAAIATFRLESLRALVWFTDGLYSLHAPSYGPRVDQCQTPQQPGRQLAAGEVARESTRNTPSPDKTGIVAPPLLERQNGTSQLGSMTDRTAMDATAVGSADVQANTAFACNSPHKTGTSDNVIDDAEQLPLEPVEHSRISSRRSTSGPTSINKPPHEEHAFNLRATMSARNDEDSKIEERPSYTNSLSIAQTTAEWNAINATAPSGIVYKSPYAPSPQDHASPQAQHMGLNAGDNLPIVSLDAPATPRASEQEHMTQPRICTPISEVQVPPSPGPKKRSKRPPPGGSGLFFRRQVIMDIIDMCNGVFPDQGEIGRPFSTLWDQRHGSVEGLEKPIASTVNETLRNMCVNPAFGLKRMIFQVRNRTGSSLTKKAMITRQNLSPSSPEVLQMAHNITHLSNEKAHQYFPEEIRHLIDDSVIYNPNTTAPKDESIILNTMSPELEAHIRRSKRRQHNLLARKKRLEAKARLAQNAQVEQASSKLESLAAGAAHGKRARLASLNDKTKRYRRAPPQTSTVDHIDEVSDGPEAHTMEKPKSLQHIPLVWTRPIVAPTVYRREVDNEESASEEDESDEEPSTFRVSKRKSDSSTKSKSGPRKDVPTIATRRGEKRLRDAHSGGQTPRKRIRLSTTEKRPGRSREHEPDADSDSEAASTPETEEDTRDGHTQSRQGTKRRTYYGRQRGKHGPLPTLVERLTGLTGDPNDPIYQLPERKRHGRSHPRPWHERKKTQRNRQGLQGKYVESVDPVARFRKLCCTLVVAASMSEEEGKVSWSIVEKVYSDEKFFDLAKTQKLWLWMQTSLTAYLTGLTTSFQTKFLDAYENGQVAAISDPDTYDWTALIRWTRRVCTHPEIPLPRFREALHKFTVTESTYETLDRARWYREKIADRSRLLLQLQHAFVAPLHRSPHTSWSSNDDVLKARSWIRANTATPQGRYDGKQARDKLMMLGESTLTSVVGDFVQKQSLRMRQLKRLLPGRNYSFTNAFAKKYVRPFELGDFMTAVQTKKEMDAAFADGIPENRFYSISRSEEDGTIAAILNLLSAGMVSLVPQLPHVDNTFGAPLPRLSIWGFCEGDYIHRAIDRGRLFWDIHVVPTAKYLHGIPLQPSSHPSDSVEASQLADWPSLPEPPLPSRHDANALTPIWSSMDGRSITWPWWYRILNLVLQPLIFQPGATPSDIYIHCAEHTTEIFEIELVLDWLESINAVSKTAGGGYVTHAGFWAAFGDKLRDTEDDWFGEHVKRKSKNHEKQQWREEYNLRHSTLQTRDSRPTATKSTDVPNEDGQISNGNDTQPDPAQQILRNPKQQYRIMQQALKSQQAPEDGVEATSPVVLSTVDALEPGGQDNLDGSGQNMQYTSEALGTPMADVEMRDIYAEGEDVDAEGEVDDAAY